MGKRTVRFKYLKDTCIFLLKIVRRHAASFWRARRERFQKDDAPTSISKVNLSDLVTSSPSDKGRAHPPETKQIKKQHQTRISVHARGTRKRLAK
jgi:hypothetical protein